MTDLATQVNIDIGLQKKGITICQWQLVQPLILSNPDYCPVVWPGGTTEQIKKLQMVQNRAA